MPLTEERIADLILRYIAKVITPEEKQELMEGYVNLSTANRLAFEKMVQPKNLLDSLRDYYDFLAKNDETGTPGTDDLTSTDPPIPDFSFPPDE
jgi:hypothetical protein